MAIPFKSGERVFVKAEGPLPEFTGHVKSLHGTTYFIYDESTKVLWAVSAWRVERVKPIDSKYPYISKDASYLANCKLTSGTVVLEENVRIDVWLHHEDNVEKCQSIMDEIIKRFSITTIYTSDLVEGWEQ